MTTYHKLENFDPTQLKFSKTKQSSGRRFINVFYDKQSLGIKLPQLRLPFNTELNRWNQLEISMSLDDPEMIKKISSIDEAIKKFSQELRWFTGNVEYCPMLKQCSSGKYSPTIKMKIPVKDSVIQTSFFDLANSKESINVESINDVPKLLQKNTKIKSVIECVGVWIIEGRFGLSWKAVQVGIFPRTCDEDVDYIFTSDSNVSNSDIELLIESE
jgi:hypothetical protein